MEFTLSYLKNILFFLLLLNITKELPASVSSEGQGIAKIIELIRSQNYQVLAAKQSHLASKHSQEGSGYFPDPIIKLNAFGSPIETRNGPQRSNLMISQAIPWPTALQAEEELALSQSKVKAEQLEILLLDLTFEVKTLIYKYLETINKLNNKKKMIVTLNNLSNIVLGRLKLGSASQAEVSRINIEVAKLTQTVRKLESKKVEILHKLAAMSGGQSIDHLIPRSLDSKWGQIKEFDPGKVDIASHPYIQLAKAKVNVSNAGIEKQKSKRLPKLGASVSWFQIDRPNGAMAGTEAGKDAWAIGASISLPLWSGKYDSLEYSSASNHVSAQMELEQRKLDLRSKIASLYEEYSTTREVSLIFRSDIIPQAVQALESDRESYTQGGAPFERVITNYIRVIKFEDQLIENQIRQAVLKAALEKLLGKSL